MFAQMVPPGREAEYFSLLAIVNKGTSALGPVVFGLAYDLTGSYRASILVIEVFFVAGILMLWRVSIADAITEAGNPLPSKL
jgi:UMF1 family MFS transporter